MCCMFERCIVKTYTVPKKWALRLKMEENTFFKFYVNRLENLDFERLKEKIKSRSIYIWGADEKGKFISDCLQRNGICINGFLDSDTKKQQEKYVFRPEEIIRSGNNKENFILISMFLKYEHEIIECLRNAGFTADDYYYPYKDWSFVYSDVGKRYDYSINPLFEKGRKIAESLDESKFYYLLYGGHIGDEAIALSWLYSFKKRHFIKSITMITSERFEALAKLYMDDINELLVWEKDELEALRVYTLSVKRKVFNILGANWVWFPRDYEIPFPINQAVYKTMHLGLPFYEKSKYFIWNEKIRKEADEIFIKKGLLKGESVILIPYAQSAASFSIDFWEKLVDILSKKYKIFTNVAKNENPIKNTTELSLPINMVPYAVNYAGYAVSIRCGLSDVLALGQCEKTLVLYNTDTKYEKKYAEINSLYINGEESILYRNAIYSGEYDTDIEIIHEICRRIGCSD